MFFDRWSAEIRRSYIANGDPFRQEQISIEDERAKRKERHLQCGPLRGRNVAGVVSQPCWPLPTLPDEIA